VLVMAGSLVMAAARRHRVAILPVDSEHNAVHQCLHERRPDEVRRLILTASGGPFREMSADALERVTPEAALAHPTWKMGRKITVDSSTLMNKGLEVIEAHWLFGVEPGHIDVVIHPQSVVHSLVELRDGSIIAQLGVTDMRLPIQYAFSYPERWETALPSLDLAQLRRLDFHEPDHSRFPCLGLAYRSLTAGGAFPVVLNAANEVAVSAFLDGHLPFTGIPRVIETALDGHASQGTSAPRDLADIRALDRWAHAFSLEQVRGVQSKC
jgi:1-deoxy-D-xylulose-5-phosphate reductoisomerase